MALDFDLTAPARPPSFDISLSTLHRRQAVAESSDTWINFTAVSRGTGDYIQTVCPHGRIGWEK